MQQNNQMNIKSDLTTLNLDTESYQSENRSPMEIMKQDSDRSQESTL